MGEMVFHSIGSKLNQIDNETGLLIFCKSIVIVAKKKEPHLCGAPVDLHCFNSSGFASIPMTCFLNLMT